MAYESTATYISQLVSSNPASSDGLFQADDHMRLIKSTLLNTFPNFTAAALTSTQANLDAAATQAARSGFVPAGAVMDFAMSTAPTGWLECTGAAVSRTTYAALFTAIGTTFGVGDGSTTFNLPPDRYRVGRTAAGAAVGTLQASQNKSHTHTGTPAGTISTVDINHTHTQGGTFTSGNVSADHTHTQQGTFGSGASTSSLSHTHAAPSNSFATTTLGTSNNNGGGGGSFGVVQGLGANTAATDLTGHAHNTTISGQTGGISANHTHDTTISGATGAMNSNNTHSHTFTGSSMTTSTGSADGTDARPLSAVFLTCIKT